MDDFVTHACEQALRFSSVNEWNDLSEQIKVQLGFNMGVIAHGLSLSKEDGYQVLTNLREKIITMKEFRDHIQTLIKSHGIVTNPENISKPF